MAVFFRRIAKPPGRETQPDVVKDPAQRVSGAISLLIYEPGLYRRLYRHLFAPPTCA